MADSEILSAIERLDSWLLRKPDPFEENYVRMRSFLVEEADLSSQMAEMVYLMDDIKEKLNSLLGEADFGEDNKENLFNFLVGITDFSDDNIEKLHSLMIGMVDINDNQKKKLYNLLNKMEDFLNEYRQELCSFGMEDFREDNKEKMYSLLAGMADYWEETNKRKLYSLLVWVAVLPESGLYKNKLIADKKKNVCSLLVEMTDLWEDEDDNGKTNEEKLHAMLLEITDLRVDKDTRELYGEKLYKKEVYGLMADIAGLCKNVKGKLNKVKVQRWLAKKADLWEQSELFRFVYELAFYNRHKFVVRDEGDKVEGIRDELRSILDFLGNKKWEEGSSLHYFVSDAVEMAHKSQNLVDVRDSDPFIIFLTFNCEDLEFISEDRIRFTDKIRAIQNWIRETKERMLEFGVERGITKSQNVGEGGQGVVVGLEEDTKLLLGIKNIHTIFITGMAGIGKTTLARILYNHAAVVDEFECHAWVCVSRESSRKEILIELIGQLVDGKECERDVGYLEKMDNKALKQMLRQQLQGMRYFIVLDDVWEKTFLEYILKALSKGEGSRLVLTTRNVDIKRDYRTDYDHTMEFLDDDKSWRLFLNTIFDGTSDQEIPKQLEKRMRKMLTKCNGLPLAITEVGGQFAGKRQLMGEWEHLLESIDLSETLAALESTYHNLSPKVKSCFLYLSFFKEGTTIRSTKVEQIWIAGGLVTEDDNIFGAMLLKLERASIIEVTSKSGRKTYCINAVFHKLSIHKAEEEMRLEILRNDGNNRLIDNPLHRVIYSSREKFTYSTDQNNKNLVSLFFHGGGYFDYSPSYWKHFQQLKILDMEDFGLKILPDAVGMLSELRYLGLRNNYIQELPCQLSQLKNLEVLDIALNFMIEVPDIIFEMSNLQHLYMSDIICQNPMKIGAMKNLQTLAYISVDDWVHELSSLEMLHGLCKLGIEELDMNTDTSKLFASLAKLKKLDHLILKGFRYRSMPSLDKLGILHNLHHLKLEGRLKRLPSADNFPKGVRHLTLVNSSLDENPMPVLENLSELRYLKLKNAYRGQQMVISSNGFHELNHLVIEELWNLRKVEVGKGAMPKLSTLDINSCPNLETLPHDIMEKDGRKVFNMETTKIIAKTVLNSDFPQNWISNIQP